jgi:hypothetical protein
MGLQFNTSDIHSKELHAMQITEHNLKLKNNLKKLKLKTWKRG